ncbi:MAG: hypothetical protein ACRD2E_05210 [Terriglobales bacterium]
MRPARRHSTAEELAEMDRGAWRQAVEEFLAERGAFGKPEQLSGGNK